MAWLGDLLGFGQPKASLEELKAPSVASEKKERMEEEGSEGETEERETEEESDEDGTITGEVGAGGAGEGTTHFQSTFRETDTNVHGTEGSGANLACEARGPRARESGRFRGNEGYVFFACVIPCLVAVLGLIVLIKLRDSENLAGDSSTVGGPSGRQFLVCGTSGLSSADVAYASAGLCSHMVYTGDRAAPAFKDFLAGASGLRYTTVHFSEVDSLKVDGVAQIAAVHNLTGVELLLDAFPAGVVDKAGYFSQVTAEFEKQLGEDGLLVRQPPRQVSLKDTHLSYHPRVTVLQTHVSPSGPMAASGLHEVKFLNNFNASPDIATDNFVKMVADIQLLNEARRDATYVKKNLCYSLTLYGFDVDGRKMVPYANVCKENVGQSMHLPALTKSVTKQVGQRKVSYTFDDSDTLKRKADDFAQECPQGRKAPLLHTLAELADLSTVSAYRLPAFFLKPL